MRVLTTLAALTLCAGAAWAQAPQSVRDAQIKKFEHERRAMLAMADSMPVRLYRDRATPAQRDFAEQIYHAASGAAGIGSMFVGQSPPALPDTATALSSREGLKGIIDSAYDFVIAAVRQQSDADRASVANLFGQEMPKWEVWDESQLHTWWTLGQVVANFRKHGMAPPEFTFF